MVDNRSAGFFGIGGAFNFKSGDASGMANALTDEKMGQGGEYFAQENSEEEVFNKNEFVLQMIKIYFSVYIFVL